MWILRLTFVCFLCLLKIGLSVSQNQASESDKLAQYYYYKCYNQTRDLKVFEKLNNDVTQFIAYLEYTAMFLPDKKKLFCENERKQLNLRIDEIAVDLEPCLPPSEKYLSDFLKTSFKEFTHFLCHNKGENVDAIFSYQNQQCKENIASDAFTSINNCFGKIFKPLSGYLSKKDLCDDLSVAEKCFAVTLDEKCPTSTSSKELNTKFFRYVSKPCAACSIQLNTFLVMLSVILSYLFNKK